MSEEHMITIDTPSALLICPFDDCKHSNLGYLKELAGKGKLFVEVVHKNDEGDFVELDVEKLIQEATTLATQAERKRIVNALPEVGECIFKNHNEMCECEQLEAQNRYKKEAIEAILTDKECEEEGCTNEKFSKHHCKEHMVVKYPNPSP